MAARSCGKLEICPAEAVDLCNDEKVVWVVKKDCDAVGFSYLIISFLFLFLINPSLINSCAVCTVHSTHSAGELAAVRPGLLGMQLRICRS